MYNNVIDTGKSVSFVLKDIDVGGQIQYCTCTGPLDCFEKLYSFKLYAMKKIHIILKLSQGNCMLSSFLYFK